VVCSSGLSALPTSGRTVPSGGPKPGGNGVAGARLQHQLISDFYSPDGHAPGTAVDGQVSGVSGWIGAQSLRAVGLSLDWKF
jgi:hypothetical protein